MIQLIGLLLAGAMVVVLIQALWPLLIAAAALWVGWAAYRAVAAQEDAEAAKRAIYEQTWISRADQTLKAYDEGRTKDWLYGKYQPAVNAPTIDKS